MGATVAAATGVTGLKMGFCGRRIDDREKQNLNYTFVSLSGCEFLRLDATERQSPASWCEEAAASERRWPGETAA